MKFKMLAFFLDDLYSYMKVNCQHQCYIKPFYVTCFSYTIVPCSHKIVLLANGMMRNKNKIIFSLHETTFHNLVILNWHRMIR